MFSMTMWWNQLIYMDVIRQPQEIGVGGVLLEGKPPGRVFTDFPTKNRITSRGASDIVSIVMLLKDLGPWGSPK